MWPYKVERMVSRMGQMEGNRDDFRGIPPRRPLRMNYRAWEVTRWATGRDGEKGGLLSRQKSLPSVAMKVTIRLTLMGD